MMDDEVDWGTYVAGTHCNHFSRYAALARDHTDDDSRLEEELENLVAAAEQASSQRAPDTVLMLAEWLWTGGGQFLDLRGHTREGIAVLTRAVDAARLQEDEGQEERLLGQLGRAWMALRNWPMAAEHFEQALALARRIGDRPGEASHLGNLVQVELERGDRAKAAVCFQAAIGLAREVGDRKMEGKLLGSLGLLELQERTRTTLLQAIDHFKEAVGIAEETGDLRGEASHLGCLGRAHELLGQLGLSLPPFVSGPYPLENDERHERHRRDLARADRESLRKAYDNYSRARSIASASGDRQLRKRLEADQIRVDPRHGHLRPNFRMRNRPPESGEHGG